MTYELESFKTFGFCVIKNAVSKEICDFITQYTLFDEMQDPNKFDRQSPGTHSKYADPAMETLLLKMQDTVEIYTNLNLHPTYSYYRIYRKDSYLSPHSDRESCEISATVCINHSYSQSDYNWPIFMNGHRIDLSPGDLAIYRGVDIRHWRENFEGNDSDWHVQGFLHYVDQNGPYQDFKFDKRNSIGLTKNTDPKDYVSNYKL